MKSLNRAILVAASCLLMLVSFASVLPANALVSPPGPSSGSVGLEGTIPSSPPSRGATITTPVNGSVFRSLPITVNGICPKGLLVKLFANNIFVGSVPCDSGSYSLLIDLFSGANDVVARVYDALDQAGPDSNTVGVTFNDAQFTASGSRVSLTSGYAERGANPGEALTYPVILSGGQSPYALSTDWGDGTSTDLVSQPFAGTVNLSHVYKTAGLYRIIIKATDANGATAYLQVVGVANGAIANSKAGAVNGSGNGGGNVTKAVVVWWPFAVLLPMLPLAFWLGRRSELRALRKHLEQARGEKQA